MKKYTHILWDWNGTLLDDVAWCVSRINVMLVKRGLPALDSVEAYHGVFGFPVRAYYERVGFDFAREPFETLAAEYMALYCAEGSGVGLFPEAADILSGFQRDGLCQAVLSASETGVLLSQVESFGIGAYFDRILGISDIYAAGKIDLGREYIKQVGQTRPYRAVLIGDTAHDKEVADALGADCVLVAGGHQSEDTLRRCKTVVAGCLAEARDYIRAADDSGKKER